ncbi:MAG: FecR domain-containing protein [Flavobacteriaceae bacterium]|nr:FecR domain-containing protein [Flavobacteriaceae bacterium]
MFEEKDDTIMARWLAGELTDAESAEFEASETYAEYLRLQQHLEGIEKPGFDKEALREKVWQGIASGNVKKVVNLRPLYYTLGIAASIVLLFGLFFSKITYSTGIGEKSEIILPDGSTVVLNAQSRLQHRRFFWTNNKTVQLEGEGFFKVTKGEGFQVRTTSGDVSVLGTEFNVKIRNEDFELRCYEGRVRFDHAPEEQRSVLEAGDALTFKDKVMVTFQHSDDRPDWQSGQSRFSNAELQKVLAELEHYYAVRFEYNPKLIEGRFTGSFVHDDLLLALKSVLVPMGIRYELSEDQKTVTLYAR